MWIRRAHLPSARMPSLRPQPAPAAPAPPLPRKAPDARGNVPTPAPQPPLSEEEERERAGGFHESSYELKTGMDVFEADWPDDTTLPGALDES